MLAQVTAKMSGTALFETYSVEDTFKTIKTNFYTSKWLPSPPQWPTVTLTFDLQNLIRSSVESTETC